MKLLELLNIRAILVKLTQAKLPAQTAYKIAKFVQKTADDEKFYQEKRQQLIEQYAKRNDKGELDTTDNQYHFEGYKEKAWNDGMAELMQTEVDAPGIKFNVGEFANVNFSAQEMMTLDAIIDEN